jgi:hypothetical protein
VSGLWGPLEAPKIANIQASANWVTVKPKKRIEKKVKYREYAYGSVTYITTIFTTDTPIVTPVLRKVKDKK